MHILFTIRIGNGRTKLAGMAGTNIGLLPHVGDGDRHLLCGDLAGGGDDIRRLALCVHIR